MGCQLVDAAIIKGDVDVAIAAVADAGRVMGAQARPRRHAPGTRNGKRLLRQRTVDAVI
jgi:hypothetical protein